MNTGTLSSLHSLYIKYSTALFICLHFIYLFIKAAFVEETVINVCTLESKHCCVGNYDQYVYIELCTLSLDTVVWETVIKAKYFCQEKGS